MHYQLEQVENVGARGVWYPFNRGRYASVETALAWLIVYRQACLTPAYTYFRIVPVAPVAPVEEPKGDDYLALAVALTRANATIQQARGGAA